MRVVQRYPSTGAQAAPDPYLVALMQGYLADQPGAFRALYRAVGPDLHSYLEHLCGPDQRQARHLLKQTFLAIHQNRSSYPAGTDPMPWFRALARECVDADSSLRRGATRVVAEPAPRLLDRVRQVWRRRDPATADRHLESEPSLRPDHSSTRIPRLVPT